MKWAFAAACCVLLLAGPFGGAAGDAAAVAPRHAARADSTIRVMTYNIRYDNPGDGEDAWPHRKERVASMIRFHQADLVGLQEALSSQIRDLAALLPGYAWFGVGRDDGREAGEFSPVFYRKDRFELIEQAVFWLSESPDVPGSIGWDAAITRLVTWGRFRDRETGRTFLLFNTHFDHRGRQAREESARLLTAQIDRIAGASPVVVTGDFNAEPSSEVYRILTASLVDARGLAAAPPHGPAETFWGFTYEAGETGRRIDYIFTRPGARVLSHGVLTDQWYGHYPSDHLPVFAAIRLR